MGITLWAMNDYLSDEENEFALFDEIVLTPLLNKELCINYLMDLHGTDELQQTHPAILKRRVNNWFNANYENFNRMAEVLFAEYNPLENYDRREHWKDVNTYDSAFDHTGHDDLEMSGSETSMLDNSTGLYKEKYKDPETTVKHQNLTENSNSVKYTGVSADNEGASGVTAASSYSPSQMETETTIPTKDTVEVDTAGERSFEGKGYNVITYGKHINQDNRRIDSQTYLSRNAHTGEDESKHDGRVHGNIGVMSTQQMVQQTLELYKFNIYEYIAAQFAVKFLYEVW